MNEFYASWLLKRCLLKIEKGAFSFEDCTRKYPQIADELKLALELDKSLPGTIAEKVSPISLRIAKTNLLEKLTDRNLSVTKSGNSRYRWQIQKRRFAMSWIIIVSTILALVSGGGVVYASENSLPGDVLYPIKTWVEDVRLAVASDQTDAELQFQFAERRLDELLALLDEDQIDDLDQSVLGYTNQVELLTQTMAKIQAQNPDEAVRLRMDLESKLQEQARRMEEAIGKADESDVYLQDRVRLMLQTNTQLRNCIQEEEETTEEDSLEATIESETLEENSDSGSSTQKQYQNKGITGKIDENLDAFKFNLGGTGSEGVYAMVAGARLSCSVKGDVAICPGNDAPERGEVELYDKQTNAFLFSFKYEHQFAHQRGNQDDTNGNEDKSGDGGSEHESGQNGTGN